ncbi:MAG: NAD(P)H-dependent oxidoreductase [Alphaproteobacteria bacterium]|nr:NAD(P)H-dependent oxidoreductase [Alphaproteobacteria bacterium]
MPRHIVIILGHPDPSPDRYCRALADAYRTGAESAGHDVAIVDVATLEFPLLRSHAEFNDSPVPDDIRTAQDAISGADHLVVIYPLWLGTLPAMLKGFFEQAFRPGFAIAFDDSYRWKKLLRGRSARVVVTMGMPALAYRFWFGAHSLRSFERNILRFSGIAPIRESLIGSVEASKPEARRKWLARMSKYGALAR